MTEHTQHTDLIDSYLSGGMTPSEETSFMDLIETDPILKEEFLFQQSIVGGLKEYRKNELKNRLSSISIGVGFFGFLMNASYYKVMAAALTLGIIGYGTYYTISEYLFEEEQKTEQFSIQSKELLAMEVDHPQLNFSTPEIPQVTDYVNALLASEKSKDAKVEVSKSVKSDQVQYRTESSKNQLVKPSGSEQTEKASNQSNRIAAVPEFIVPAINEEPVEEESLSGISINVNNLESIGISESEEDNKVEIEQVKRNNKIRQYKFEEGKLYLYGDYSGDPYELLEINSKGQKTLYFYHQKLYYRLDRFQKSATTFEQIKDKKLVRELEIIRTSK
ncbi:MAG: hypothetical protein AAFQ94_01165 [Bacteroidota bacterium]